jgi:DNA-binding GntR family transcriptional regulator
MNGAYQPGERINEVEIAKELNVSRSPVHCAITELTGEGLLESVSNKSIKVRQLSHKQVLDIFEYRVLVESYALGKFIPSLTPANEKAFRLFRQEFLDNATYDKLAAYVDVDARFHRYIVDCSGNDIVSDSFHRYSVLISPFRVISLKSKVRFSDSIKEHVKIIDAILSDDVSTAVATNEEHLNLASEEINTYFINKKKEKDS